MVTVVPPAAGPDVGLTLVTEGGKGCGPIWYEAVWAVSVSEEVDSSS